MSIEDINFDIFYKILENLDSSSFRNLLLSSKKLYEYHNHNNQTNLLLIKKIIEKFPILKNVHLKIKYIPSNLLLYKFLNKLDNIYKDDIKISNLLIHYIHFDRNDDLLYLFEFLIDNCYNNNKFLNKVEQHYISIHILPRIIKYTSIKELDIMIKTINIHYKSITIYFDYITRYETIEYEKINKLFNYLCWKYFFGFQNETSDIDSHNILFCKLIEISESLNGMEYRKRIDERKLIDEIVHNIIDKQKKYKFIFDYQKLFNTCIIYNSEYYLDFISNNLYNININRTSKNLNKIFITITSYNIEFLVNNRLFSLLNKIIEIHLGSLINLNIYIKKIKECIINFSKLDIIKLKFHLQPYLTDYNKDYLFKIDRTIC